MLCLYVVFLLMVVSIDGLVRVDNYEGSVYLMMGRLQGLKKMEEDTIYFTPKDYDFFTVKRDVVVTLDDNVTKKTGNLVSFKKFIGDDDVPTNQLVFLFTNKNYYNVIRRTMMQV